MQRIGLDLRVLCSRNYSGIPRYAYNLARELTQYESEEYLFISELKGNEFPEEKRIYLDLPNSNSELANKLLSYTGYKEKIDLLFSPYFPIPKRRTFKGVLVIHDLIPLRFPDFYTTRGTFDFFDKGIRKAAIDADHVIADSYATKADIIDFFGIAESKISVVHLAAFTNDFSLDKSEEKKMNVLKKYGIKHPYFLSVCTIEPRKNLSRVLKAYEMMRSKSLEAMSLVLVGGLGWKYQDLLNEIATNRFRDDIIMTGFVSDEELGFLYGNAQAFVYASIYEGFGLPVLEAMSLGAPVITANSSSLPEVAGDAAIYCDPLEIESIASAMEQMITSTDTQKHYIQAGLERSSLFSWKRTAEETRQIFFKCLYDAE